jgi:WD40 repeat protein
MHRGDSARKLGVVALGLVTALAAAPALPADPSVHTFVPHPGEQKSDAPSAGSQAAIAYLQALALAEQGSKPEALQFVANSLRLQPAGNPAAALAFELLTELRTNSSLELRGHTAGVLFAAYSPDGTKIITASQDHTARIWDARTGRPLLPPLQHNDDVLMAVFSPDGRRVATGSEDGTARLWDAATGQPIGVPMRETDAMRYLQFSPDGQLLATGSDDNKARLWDAHTGQPVTPEIKYHESVFSINFSPDGSKVLTATGDGKADLLDARTGQPLPAFTPIRHQNNIFTAVFSPDGKRILTASADHTARVWDAANGRPLGPVFLHGYWVFSAAFNHDATEVVTASWDHTARVWNAVTDRPITPPLRHADAVISALFNPRGTLVATGSKDHTARLWSAATGDPLSLPLRADGEVTSVLFNPSGSSLLVTANDPVVRVYDLPPDEPAPVWLADLAQFASTQVSYDVSRTADLGNISQLRARLLASTSGDPWEKFGRWYFMETADRPISPWSTVSLKEYVDVLTARGDRDSLDYAIALSHDLPAWMVKLQPLRAKLGAATPAPGKSGAAKDD